MSTPTIHPRSAWTSVAPTGVTRVSWPSIKIVNIHWPGRTGVIPRDRAAIVRALEAWRRYHMSDRGWRDIAYNVAVDLNGDVWVLRGWDVQDGGVAGRSDDVTILLVMGTGDKMTDAMKRSTLWCMREFERRKGGQLLRSWHGALSSTSCPGPEATAWGRAGFPAPAADPLVHKEPVMPDPLAYPGVLLGRYPNSTGTRVDRHPAVGTVQGWLDLEVDNVYGPATEAAVQAFQRAEGFAPEDVDGIVGRQTWERMVARFATPEPEPAPTPTPQPEPTPAPDGEQLDRIEAALGRIEARLADPQASIPDRLVYVREE